MSELAEKARRARIKPRAGASQYRRFWPTVAVLSAKGCNAHQIASWIVDQGEWPAERRSALYQAIRLHMKKSTPAESGKTN